MLTKADVFIQNLAPGALERLGFACDTLTARYPQLIVCSISGYGEDGPYRLQKAYDLLIQAESGLCAINGTAAEAARGGVSVCDIAAGMSAHQSILQALFARERQRNSAKAATTNSNGRVIEVSLFHAMADWMNVPYLQYRYGNTQPGRHGLHHPTIAPYGAYPCADDKLLLISIQNEREWQQLCTEVLQQPALATQAGFATNSERVANRITVDNLVAEAFARYTREENIEHLKNASIAYGRLSELDDMLKHPQNRYHSIEGEAGPIELLAPAARVNNQPLPAGKVPTIGEHSEQIRREFN